MALAAAYNAYPSGQSRLQNTTLLFGTLTASGSYATGGDALALPQIPGYDATKIIDIFIHGIAGYKYEFDIATSKVLVFTAGETELTAGAYPSGITGDTITFLAVVKNSY
jgi:hypothetical protein